jgi:hypothetical protein
MHHGGEPHESAGKTRFAAQKSAESHKTKICRKKPRWIIVMMVSRHVMSIGCELDTVDGLKRSVSASMYRKHAGSNKRDNHSDGSERREACTRGCASG